MLQADIECARQARADYEFLKPYITETLSQLLRRLTERDARA